MCNGAITYPKAINRSKYKTTVRSRLNRMVALIMVVEMMAIKARFNWLVEATPATTARIAQLELRRATLMAMAEKEIK